MDAALNHPARFGGTLLVKEGSELIPASLEAGGAVGVGAVRF